MNLERTQKNDSNFFINFVCNVYDTQYFNYFNKENNTETLCVKIKTSSFFVAIKLTMKIFYSLRQYSKKAKNYSDKTSFKIMLIYNG